MVATMLLAVSMGARTLVPSAYETPPVAVTQVEKAVEPSGHEIPATQTTVSALTLDAVVISLFSFQLSPYFLPFSQWVTRFCEERVVVFAACFSEPLFFFCYLQKVFGKQIAANAP
jgi:hypothetical protein